MENTPALRGAGLDLAILSVLRANGPLPTDDVAEALGVSLYTVRLALHRLAQRGRALRHGRAPRARGAWGGTQFIAVWAAAPDPN